MASFSQNATVTMVLSQAAEQTLRESRRFLKEDVPEILGLTAKAVQKNKLFPVSWREATSYSQSDWLDIIPIWCGVLVAVSYLFLPVVASGGGGSIGRVLFGNTRKPVKYDLTRSVLLRAQVLCYGCGFLTSAFQHRTLWGEHGLVPANPRSQRPTPIFDYVLGYGDLQLELLSFLGFYLCFLLVRYESTLVAGLLWLCYLTIVNMQAPFTYGYGWEWLTCEAGFLAIFLCSPPKLLSLPKKSVFHSFFVGRGGGAGKAGSSITTSRCTEPAPVLVIMLYRWMAFRLLIGAGMSKVGRNSSACWRELTCTTTHYFTQPIPNPLSWYFHFLPEVVHKVEVAMTFFEQLAVPYMMLTPIRSLRILAGLVEIFFQLCIVGTGNYAWINFIGITPCLALFDDEFLLYVWSWLCWLVNTFICFLFFSKSGSTSEGKSGAATLAESSSAFFSMPADSLEDDENASLDDTDGDDEEAFSSCYSFVCSLPFRLVIFLLRLPGLIYRCLYHTAIVILVFFMVYKSKEPIRELFSAAPWINNYDDYFFITSQGVFGFINALRVQLVLEYRHDGGKASSGSGSGGQVVDLNAWKPLDFKCIPGSVDRRPCFLSPYHSRLDWETWIRTTASFEHVVGQFGPQAGQAMQHNMPEFIGTLVSRILDGDENAARLMGTSLEDLYYPRSKYAEFSASESDSKKTKRKKELPAEIRASFYLYEFQELGGSAPWFASASALQTSLTPSGASPWWKRTALTAPGMEHVYRKEGPQKTNKKKKIPYGNSHEWRLPTCMLSLALAGFMCFSGQPARRQNPLVPRKRKRSLERNKELDTKAKTLLAETDKSQEIEMQKIYGESTGDTAEGKAVCAKTNKAKSNCSSSTESSESDEAMVSEAEPEKVGPPPQLGLTRMLAIMMIQCLCFSIFALCLVSDYQGSWVKVADMRGRIVGRSLLSLYRRALATYIWAAPSFDFLSTATSAPEVSIRGGLVPTVVAPAVSQQWAQAVQLFQKADSTSVKTYAESVQNIAGSLLILMLFTGNSGTGRRALLDFASLDVVKTVQLASATALFFSAYRLSD
ncbi:unnamed protein product [Amoebophrya sp. A25]|nr:unnamed protein product [Amoebophrya sp. A25]|eukprot:GSA25T00021599001.1